MVEILKRSTKIQLRQRENVKDQTRKQRRENKLDGNL